MKDAAFASDLQASAARLRAQSGGNRERRSAPPEENGVRLATIQRGADEEVRLSWSEYNGRHFLNIRVWSRRDDGWWPEKGKGMTVRLRELPDFAEGVAKAVQMATSGAHHGG